MSRKCVHSSTKVAIFTFMKGPKISGYAEKLLEKKAVKEAVSAPPRHTLTIQLPATATPTLTVSEVCKLTGLPRDHVYRLVRVGWVASVRLTPNKLRIFRVSLDQHMRDVRDPAFWTKERRLDWSGSF